MNPIPLSQWETQGNIWPTCSGWHNMLRPKNMRQQLLDAGVVNRVNGRWIIFPDKWREFCATAPENR